MSWTLHHGDCLAILPALASGSVDVVVTDPPYPEIDRDYGRLTEAEWFILMRRAVPECMRVLKPTGSAVFILQPNSERAGRMRTWLWEFMAWVGKKWGIVQDAWWWNFAALPLGGACRQGLMRPSVKACVWVGPPDCHRAQDKCLWLESETNRDRRLTDRFPADFSQPARRRSNTEGPRDSRRRMSAAAEKRGGVTPFNLLPVANAASRASAGAFGHGAGTPFALCSWWIRYLCPEGGTVLDPFAGSGTVGLAASKHGCRFIGVELDKGYHDIAAKRLREAAPKEAAA